MGEMNKTDLRANGASFSRPADSFWTWGGGRTIDDRFFHLTFSWFSPEGTHREIVQRWLRWLLDGIAVQNFGCVHRETEEYTRWSEILERRKISILCHSAWGFCSTPWPVHLLQGFSCTSQVPKLAQTMMLSGDLTQIHHQQQIIQLKAFRQ